MNLKQLAQQVRAGKIDTVIVALADPFGRLVGKRFRAELFLDGRQAWNPRLQLSAHGEPAWIRSTDSRLPIGRRVSRLLVSTRPGHMLRIIPWQAATAIVICDHVGHDGSYVAESPRLVLRAQLAQLKKQGLTCYCASELEFYLFNQTYHSAHTNGYCPTSSLRAIIGFIITSCSRPADEPLMRAIRNGMTAARVPVESSKGEWSRGQHEINFVYNQPLPMADMHVLFKQGVKEMAEQQSKAISFMAKYAPSEVGQLVPHPHEHLERWPQFVPRCQRSLRLQYFRQSPGGLIKYSPELCLFFGPTINSYKRYQPGSWRRHAWPGGGQSHRWLPRGGSRCGLPHRKPDAGS